MININKNKATLGTGSGMSAKQRAYASKDTMNSNHKNYVAKAEAKGQLSPKLRAQLDAEADYTNAPTEE